MVNPLAKTQQDLIKNKVSLLVEGVTGKNDLNLEFGSNFNELGFDYTDPKMDKKISKEIKKENSNKKKELINNLKFSEKYGETEKVKRYKILLELDSVL